MDKVDAIIVGAGFAGSVCAERLAHAGKSVLLIDRRSHIGGNAYDYYDQAGVLVHKYGAHVFHTNAQLVVDYLSQFTAWRKYEHRVISCAHVDHDYIEVPMPINRTTLAAFNGDAARARQVLVEGYTRKQWGEHAPSLSPTVLARIAPRDTDDDRYFTDAFQAMPRDGYTRLFERMLAHPRIKIMLQTNYREVCELLTDGGRYMGHRPTVIYTGPIDEFFNYEFGKLPYRSARFEFTTSTVYGGMLQQRVGVMNSPNAEIPWTRRCEFRHLTGQVHNATTIAFEYPQDEGEPFWPVPTAASAALYDKYRAAAARVPGVFFLGRLGTYRYYDMHQVIAQALTFCESLLSPGGLARAHTVAH